MINSVIACQLNLVERLTCYVNVTILMYEQQLFMKHLQLLSILYVDKILLCFYMGPLDCNECWFHDSANKLSQKAKKHTWYYAQMFTYVLLGMVIVSWITLISLITVCMLKLLTQKQWRKLQELILLG